jgi:transcription antitermination factor NusG
LFNGYLFARVRDRWSPIERSLGVSHVSRFGPAPARVPDAEIAKLIARAGADGVVRLAQPPSSKAIAAGARVRVIAGPLAGFDGIHTGMSAHERELVLFNVMGAPRPVEIGSDLLVAR